MNKKQRDADVALWDFYVWCVDLDENNIVVETLKSYFSYRGMEYISDFVIEAETTDEN